MWISWFLLRAAMKIYPQPYVETEKLFHKLCGDKFRTKVFHSGFLHIPQRLWKKINVGRGHDPAEAPRFCFRLERQKNM